MDYLQQFKNRYEVATSHGAGLYDQAVAVMLMTQTPEDAAKDFDVDLSVAEHQAYQERAERLCQAVAFLSQSDKKHYGELLSDLENDYIPNNISQSVPVP
jgi:hypothetical protein